MIKKNKLKITIGIPAYNAEKNVELLLQSLTMQVVDNYNLDKIIVYSDASSDKTSSITKKIIVSNHIIHLIDAKKRNGFAYAVKYLLHQNTSDVLVLLNDDIIIKDKFFIEKTIVPFYNELHVGMVCSNPLPYKPQNFIEKAVASGFRAFEKVRIYAKNGNTVLTCDGKTMSFSKKFIDSVKLPQDLKAMGNVDGYMYFTCIKNGFLYKFAEDALVYFKCPSTIKDFIKWTTRNNITRSIFQKKFGNIVVKEYEVPFMQFSYYRMIEFFKNPLGCTFLFLVGAYCSVKAKLNTSEFNTTWDLVDSTKELKYI